LAPQALGPGQSAFLYERAIPVGFDAVTLDAMFEPVRFENPERPILLAGFVRRDNSNAHLFSIPCDDRLETRRLVEGIRARFADAELDAEAGALEIDDAAGLIRSFIVFEATLKP
jgi:hypothetical protein